MSEPTAQVPLEVVRGLLETIKTTTYEFLALLLPGVVLLFAIDHAAWRLNFPVVGWLIASYIIGLAIQGAGSLMEKVIERIGAWRRRRKARRAAAGEQVTLQPEAIWKDAELFATEILRTKIGAPLPSRITFDICLSRVEARRYIYDKFISLRDTTRGLAVVTLPATGLMLWHHRAELSHRGWFLAIAAALICFAALLDRTHRYSPLARQAVYGQYLATLIEPEKGPGKEKP